MNTTVIFLNQCTAFISVASFDFVLLLFFSDLWPLCMVKIQSDGKESASNEGDPGSIPGLGRSPGEGKGYPLQYSDLENSMGSQRVGHD